MQMSRYLQHLSVAAAVLLVCTAEMTFSKPPQEPVLQRQQNDKTPKNSLLRFIAKHGGAEMPGHYKMAGGSVHIKNVNASIAIKMNGYSMQVKWKSSRGVAGGMIHATEPKADLRGHVTFGVGKIKVESGETIEYQLVWFHRKLRNVGDVINIYPRRHKTGDVWLQYIGRRKTMGVVVNTERGTWSGSLTRNGKVGLPVIIAPDKKKK